MLKSIEEVFQEQAGYIYNENEELRQSQRLLAGLVGFVALSLPISLIVFGEWFTEGRSSISSYYYESIVLSDIFVGGLFLVGGLMLTYRGNSQWASRLATSGGVLAMLVGAFPTNGWTRCATLYSSLGVDQCDPEKGGPEFLPQFAKYIHVPSAIVLFIVLALFCYFVFLKPRTRLAFDGTEEDNSGDSSKKLRNLIYWLCLLALLGAMAVIALHLTGLVSLPDDIVFWGEAVGLVAFGIAWLTHSRFFFLRWFSDSDDPVYWGGKKKQESIAV